MSTELEQAMSPARTEPTAPYLRYVATAGSHTLSMMPKRKMTLLALALAFGPLIIPLSLLLSRDIFLEVSGQDVFVRIVQFIYINALCPLPR